MKIKRTAKGNYQVTMNEDEARTVYVLSAYVSGSPNSPRKHVAKFFGLMEDALDTKCADTLERKLIDASIYFEDYPDE